MICKVPEENHSSLSITARALQAWREKYTFDFAEYTNLSTDVLNNLVL